MNANSDQKIKLQFHKLFGIYDIFKKKNSISKQFAQKLLGQNCRPILNKKKLSKKFSFFFLFFLKKNHYSFFSSFIVPLTQGSTAKVAKAAVCDGVIIIGPYKICWNVLNGRGTDQNPDWAHDHKKIHVKSIRTRQNKGLPLQLIH